MTPSKRGIRPHDPSTDGPTDIASPAAPWDPHGESSVEPYIDETPSVNPTREHVAQRDRSIMTAGDTPPNPASATGDAELAPGTKLGEYKVDQKIGEGGMGVVYSAIHPLIGKRAAVKVLKAELCRAAFNVERFIDEARVVNQIGHPNIVDVFAFGQTSDGRSYFVMEWLKGESLRDRVARSRLDLDEICDVMRPLARALEAAHEQGVIHRDLKPDNIFLVDVRGEAPLVKLLDFGIAKLAREEHRMERTATGAMVGTPQYIAPEQAKGYAIDHRVDIYSLGGIIFELLTGQPPFVADNAMEMVAKHLMEPAPRPSTLAHVPPELDDLVVRMLAKDPAQRPTLAEVATVIERTSALDRTNVKTVVAPPNRDTIDDRLSAPINAPTPTPMAPHERAVPAAPIMHETNPALGKALARAMASPGPRTSISDMTETIRAPRRMGRRGIIVLMAVATMLAAAVAFAIVWTAGDAKKKLAAPAPDAARIEPIVVEPPRPAPPPVVEPVVEPIVEPSNPAPAVAPPPSDPPKPAVVKKPPVKDPPPPRKKQGRLELAISGGKGPTTIKIDGKAASTSSTLAPGVYTVEVLRPGMHPKKLKVTVVDNQTTRTEVELDPVPAPKPPEPKPPDKKPNTGDLLAPGSLDK